MTFINQIAGVVIGGLTGMMTALPAWLVLSVHGTLMALLALACYALVSNQAAIKKTKGRLMARLLEIRLFQDDPLIVLGAFGRVLGGTVVYLKDSLMPLLVMLPIAVLWIAQLAGWFEWRPLQPGETAVVKAMLKPGTDPAAESASLEAPAGFEVETAPFRSTADSEVLWRVRATGSSTGSLLVNAAGSRAEMKIVSGNQLAEVAPRRLGVANSFWDRLLYPMAKPLPSDSAIQEIRIDYPQRSLSIAGFEVNWLIWLLVASIVLGFVLKKPFGVEF